MKLNHILSAAALLGLLPAAPLFAAGIAVSLTPVTVAPGTTGDFFDIVLTNSGPAPVDIAGFSIELNTTSTAITFTDSTTGTASPYIFAGDSAFGPDLGGVVSNQLIDVNDLDVNANQGTTVGVGNSVGLGRVYFSVATGTAAGQIPVTFAAFPFTSLSDPTGTDIPITTETTGDITISAGTTPVPEPSSVMLLLMTAGTALPFGVRRMRARFGDEEARG